MLKGQFIMRIIHEFDEDEIELAHTHLHSEDYYNALYDINKFFHKEPFTSRILVSEVIEKLNEINEFYDIHLER
jgi:hypothetical protein